MDWNRVLEYAFNVVGLLAVFGTIMLLLSLEGIVEMMFRLII